MSAANTGHDADNGDRDLFVLPHERREGFWTNIRGHVLDLADPDTAYGRAPNPDDPFVASIASDLAWTARKILRERGLPDDVSVSATWRATADPPSLADVHLTIALSEGAETANELLSAALDTSLAARSLVAPVVRISWDATG